MSETQRILSIIVKHWKALNLVSEDKKLLGGGATTEQNYCILPRPCKEALLLMSTRADRHRKNILVHGSKACG